MAHNFDAEFGIWYPLTLIAIYLGLIAGWVMNVAAIWNTMDNDITAKFILRVIGVFVFPIGAILGYL